METDSATCYSRRVLCRQEINPISLCLIDGDGCIFSEKYLNDGDQGGKAAAASLKQELTKLLDADSGPLCTFIYMNQAGLREVLANSDTCTAAKFNDFVTGFNRSTELFNIIDVGRGKEAADAKIRGELSPHGRTRHQVTYPR